MRLLGSLHDRTSGNLRGVHGFEAQVEAIERSVTYHLIALQLNIQCLRRYHECYMEMTIGQNTLQWSIWVVCFFRSDPYLSELVALDEELSYLLERIAVSDIIHPVYHILSSAVRTVTTSVTTLATSSLPP